MQEFLDYYGKNLATNSTPYPGALHTLNRLKQAGLPLGVVTNKPEHLAKQLLDQLDMSHWFGAILGGDTLASRKPDPEPLQQAAKQLGFDIAQGLMVGDSKTDVQAARNAGCRIVAVTYGYHGDTPVDTLHADWVIDSLEEVPLLVGAA
ncbi:putative phosphoglycolate phosphatase [Magnetofaba australis IT-1]|uniref:phosphoglycolate phosphatase n=1 Tax=Magnetofaba australis IT-1 TaxID=1434232 RepID=A0A1Y2K276_9PROT|nr:putative phosphoglycolate phosphatase [Magnetofaba australis IT-1]